MTVKYKFSSVILLVLMIVMINTSVASAAPAVPPATTISNFQFGDSLGFYGDPVQCYVGSCPSDLSSVYPANEKCVSSFEDFKKNPATNHYWVEDPKITAQGKADERARQFIYWVINAKIKDDTSVLTNVWSNTRNIAYFLIILVAAVMGVGMIVGQRANFDTKIKVWPSITKIVVSLLYITFSATIVFLLIQLSEVFMKFFTENLGGRDLFNIYFGTKSTESNYVNFIGCRDLNYRVQESVNAELFLLQLKNIIFYLMGGMILLRKIILWFLLIVSPFIAVMFPFVFIRNVAWIWIGVFFQWLFYGPLLSIFLGALSMIWRSGIPYIFDFSRAGKASGYIYPTATTILFGGPAQQLTTLNNVNYIDTFAEYVISLIMLLAVIFFPWWLLRIFRDYCCDGINAAKNILMSMYDNMRSGPSSTPPLSPSPSSTTIGTTLKIPSQVEIPIRIKLETIEEIKKVKTEEISRSLNLSASKITDVARFETNKNIQETVRRNLNYLANPTRAETPIERQKFMNIRTELFNRAVKEDRVAKQILIGTSTSKIEQVQKKQEIARTIPQMTPVDHIVSSKFNIPQQKISSINAALIDSVISNTPIVNSIAQTSQLPIAKVQTVLTSFKAQSSTSLTNIVDNIVKETGLVKQQVIVILQEISKVAQTNKELIKEIAQKENIKEEQITEFVTAQIPLVTEPEKHIEQIVSIPSSISIEDYEEVKKMWQQQYEKGEVPVTENITSRVQWLDQDIVFITNTLNKLVSTDEKLRMEGLDDVAYILPVFLINNLKGEELVVYLKAKLEAAKTIQLQLEKEKEITEKLKSKSQEELINVEKPKVQEAAKTMEMKQELKL